MSNYTKPYGQGYGQDFRTQHEEMLAQQEKEQKERERENQRLRDARLAGIEADRQARLDAQAAEVDRQLEPTKARERAQWLYDHPTQSAADFERLWHLRKQALLADEREQLIAQEVQAQRERRRY